MQKMARNILKEIRIKNLERKQWLLFLLINSVPKVILISIFNHFKRQNSRITSFWKKNLIINNNKQEYSEFSQKWISCRMQ